jgi:hypothetical protein
MSWHTPVDWSTIPIPDHDDFNEQIRDNLNVLKTSRNDAGKILGLSSSYLLDLSGLNLTGVGLLASANTLTAKNTFSGAGRLVIPVEGAYTGTDAGDMAVVGQNLVYKDSAGTTKTFAGTSNGSPGGGALAGSIWIEGSDLHYISSTGVERIVPGAATAMHSDAAASAASLWGETTYLHWIIQTGTSEMFGHIDSHTDSGHGDVAHVDTHSDTHTDTAHQDSHTDHSDTGHADAHADAAHVDTHSDTHTDTHTDAGHGDVAHGDQPT